MGTILLSISQTIYLMNDEIIGPHIFAALKKQPELQQEFFDAIEKQQPTQLERYKQRCITGE